MPSMAEKQLDGQVVVVTGGTAGIGRAVCLCLAAHGAHVVIVARNRERLERTAAEVRRQASRRPLCVCGDVRREDDMNDMARATVKRFGRIDALVASAGILRPRGRELKTLVQMSPREWDEVVDTNLKGVFLSNRAVLPAMLTRRCGHIVNLSSTSGRHGYAFDSAYCASKFGVISLTEALAEEVRSYGVRVQVLLPGAIDTPMWDQNGPLPRPEYALPPERVADVVLHLLVTAPDAIVVAPVIEPFVTAVREGWRGSLPGRAEEASSRERGARPPQHRDMEGVPG